MCPHHSDKEESADPQISYDRSWPEERREGDTWLGLVCRRWTYSYMNKLLDKGSKQTLDDGTNLCPDDLYRVPHTLESDYLVSKFRQHYEAERHRKRPFIWTLWRLAAPTFVPAGFCQLITVFAQVAIPLFVMQLLKIVEDNSGEKIVDQGIQYAILLFVASLVNAFGNHRHRHLATKSGIVMRASVVSVIYHNALHLTPEGRKGLTTGEVTNLLAIDTQKLFEVTQEGHLIWSCPLSMLLVLILLLIVMGPTTLVGMAVLVMFVPLVQMVASKMLAIRRERIKITDERVEIVSAMLQGIRVTKLNNYETKYKERILEARKREVDMLRRELFVWAVTLFMTVVSPVLASASTFVTYVLVSEDNILTASRTFTVLLLFSALRFPINYTGRLIGRAAQAMEACRRLSAFLNRETRSEDDQYMQGRSPRETSCRPLLELTGATFYVGGDHRSSGPEIDASNIGPGPEDGLEQVKGFSVKNISFALAPGQILAVVGPVGAGKSSLVSGIIGELPCSPSSVVNKSGRVAYASQTPFILNATLRENILFGSAYEKERYEAVLDACCLRPDLKTLGISGDLTEIGERGVTLSGGQKARVSLARVAYSAPEIVLCDDPLSALDASTGKKIFDRLFKSKDNSLLASSAIVLVTHAAHFLNQVDQIMVMVQGQAKFLGTWDELVNARTDEEVAAKAIDFIRLSVQEVGDHDNDAREEVLDDQTSLGELRNGKPPPEEKGTIMSIETREHGLSKLGTWLLWFKYAGGLPFLFTQVLLLGLDRFFYIVTELWLTVWTKGHDQPVESLGREFPAQTDGRSAQYEYVLVYAIILAVSSVATFLRSEWAVSGGARCAKHVFQTMVGSVLRAPMSYFETTPLGRILNRFTYDIEVVDLTLTESMSVLMISCSWFVAGVTIQIVILPWIALALFPVVVAYSALLLRYRKSGPDLQRIDALTRSPIQAMLSEGLDGAATIRVYGREHVFLGKFHLSVDSNSSALMNYISAQRWLGVRIELLGSTIVLISTVLIVSLNDILGLDPGLAALLIIWSANFTITLGFLVDAFSESEAAITSIERVSAMAHLPEESEMETDPSIDLSPSWPSKGEIKFDNVSLRYRAGLSLALKGLTFSVMPGERCGIVGRTGSGKSTTTIALFRLVEIETGSIVVDGVDISTLGLSDVRGRLSIIPQDPFLLAGTLRDCLDPFGGSTDGSVLAALVAVRLANEGDWNVLESRVEEGGANFSVGERQLLCLARALLSRPKILVMDEATASVDGETDAFIQRMLRTRFQDTTLLTVAHRLNTIMDYDSVLVMEDGRAVEKGPPSDLLKQDGPFSALVQSTGDESARALRNLAGSL